jgi:hypothetical protein
MRFGYSYSRGTRFSTCRGYNPGYTKVPLYLLLTYTVNIKLYMCRIIKTSNQQGLGRIISPWAGILLYQPEYNGPSRIILIQTGIERSGPAWRSSGRNILVWAGIKALPGWAGLFFPAWASLPCPAGLPAPPRPSQLPGWAAPAGPDSRQAPAGPVRPRPGLLARRPGWAGVPSRAVAPAALSSSGWAVGWVTRLGRFCSTRLGSLLHPAGLPPSGRHLPPRPGWAGSGGSGLARISLQASIC